ncbi:hypothetical protein [Streptomyces kronopolitis]|uniref:hypothetical protein n=1 Tax=Streptomyces kronopolitis TaxID=1612435 RepID=UPI003D97F034
MLEVPASDDRCAAAAEVDQALDWEARTIIWPSDSRHVIICRPRAHEREAATAELLKPVLRAAPLRTLGVCAPLPWAQAAQGYLGALKALETVRTSAEGLRVAVYDSGPPLSTVLAETGKAWAASLLRPVREAAGTEAEYQRRLEAARLSASVGTVRAAKLLGRLEADQVGPHRNTVAKRFSTTAEQAGLGDGLADRAVLDLALQLLDTRHGVATLASPKVRSLRELLQDPEVESWASSLLGCLSAEQVDLLAVRRCFTWRVGDGR